MGIWGIGSRDSRLSHHSLTPFLPLVMHVLIRERRPRKEPSFGSALAGGVSGDTLLQQTSMMVEHRRPGWWPSSRLGCAYSFRKPCYNYHPHTPRSGRRRALVRASKRWEKRCVLGAYKIPPASSENRCKWSSRAHLVSRRQVVSARYRLFSLAYRPAE